METQEEDGGADLADATALQQADTGAEVRAKLSEDDHAKAAVAVAGPEAQPLPQETSRRRRPLAETTLIDRARYRGQVNDEGLPDGLGTLYTALGTHVYAGMFQAGAKCGLGVRLLPNGTQYAGEFHSDYECGYGVKRDPFGGQYVGQWREGELDGIGLSTSADGETQCGIFHLNELVNNESISIVWSDVESHVHRALLAEQRALQAQEEARRTQVQVLLRGLTAIDGKTLASTDEIAGFSAHEEQELRAFLRENKTQLADVEREADRWKFREAQLKERQKNLRREIDAARAELAYVAKAVEVAETRHMQLRDAERTLDALQKQIEALQSMV